MTLDEILNAVSKVYGYPVDSMRTKILIQPLPEMRQMYCYFAFIYTDFTLDEISSKINLRPRTVEIGYKKIDGLSEIYGSVKENITRIKNILMPQYRCGYCGEMIKGEVFMFGDETMHEKCVRYLTSE